MVGMPQTKAIAKLFSDGTFDEIPRGECAQYVLKDLKAGVGLCYIKVHREGYMTASQVGTIVKMDLENLEMEFIRFIPSTTLNTKHSPIVDIHQYFF